MVGVEAEVDSDHGSKETRDGKRRAGREEKKMALWAWWERDAERWWG